MSKRKLLLWIATVCLLVALLPATVFAATDGWSQNSDGTYSYYQNGEMVTDEVVEIDGEYYGFNWNGVMYDNTTFDLYDYDEGRWVYYRAQAGGALIVNQWYETEWGEWYYYGAGGEAAEDFTQIGGVWYYFDYEGRMIQNSLVWSEDYNAYYIISEDGTSSVQAPENGWASLDGTYYYMDGGEPIDYGVYQIGGVWYGFGWDGRMFADTDFNTNEYVDDEWVYTYYRAQASGALIVNDWYQDEWGTWYYYGEGGVAAKDFTQIGSTWYFFGENGYMVTNQIVWSEKYQANYYIGEDGTTSQLVPENGWFYMNGETYYFQNGEMLESGVYFIDDTYYGFNWNGEMYTDTTFSFYEKDGEVYYRAKATGELYVNEWYYYDDYAYYYGVGGAAPSDFYQIGSTWYFFENNGRMVKDQIVWSEIYQKSYIISADGTSSQEVPTDGWVYVGEDTYYMVDGQMVENTSYQIGGYWYFFGWDGAMHKDGIYHTSYYDETLGRSVHVAYRAKEDGVLYVNEWVKYGGESYYYADGGKGYSDFLQVGGVWYFLDYGRMVTDELVWSNAYQAYYVISADGTSSRQVTANGWIQAGEYWYYMADGSLYESCVYKIGGAYYGFDYEGRMRTDEVFHTDYYDGEEYHYGSFRAREDGTLVVNAWYQEGSYWYYYGQYGIAPDDFYQIGGVWYYFSDGRMVTDSLVWSDAYQSYYVISVDGASSKQVASTGWVQTSKDWYYMKDGVLYEGGVYKIGGAYYGFDYQGRMRTDDVFHTGYYDGEEYHYGYFRAREDGTLVVNGWHQGGSYWYYYGQHGIAPEDFYQIGSTWYFFEYQGRMVTDELVYSDLYEGWYVISASGTSSRAVSSGWVQVGGDYYYITEGGELAEYEVLKIGGFYYGFDYNGVMYTDTRFNMESYNEEEDNWEYNYYRAKADGTLYVNKWYQDGDEWYYYGAEGKGADGFTQLGGIWYYFSDGYMYTDTTVWDSDSERYYAVDKNGVMISAAGWHIVEGSYVYAAAGGALAEGWKQIGGIWYYFYPQMAANELLTDEGVMYAVNNSGVCTPITTNGIYDIGYSGKVYVENGKVYEGWKQLGGSWYYFDPYMYKNDVYEIDGTQYVFDQNGKMFTGGWLYLGNGWDYGYYVYADSLGRAYTGVKTIGSTKYVFSDWGTLYTDTIVVYDGVSYVVDKNGAVVSTSSANGWQLINGKYYYKHDGYYLEGEAMVIDGSLYAFDYDGAMITNRIVDTYVYDWGYEYMLLGANGAALKGWQKYGGEWVYADSDGFLVNGRQTIGGSEYIFLNWRMQTGTFVWDESIITTNGGGAIVDEKDMADGWTYSEGTVYYYKNGEYYTGWVGDYYVRDGVMRVNGAVYDEAADCYYAVNTYGRYVKSGWYQRQYPYNVNYPDYYYAKAGGKLAQDEWLQLGGIWYYFDHIYMVYDSIIEIDGELCEFDENGKYLGVVGAVTGNDGWKQVGSDWYYLHAGEPVVGMKTIGGSRYLFDWDGVMLSGGFVGFEGEYYYADSNGVIQNYTGWKQFNGKWCYFDSSNRAVTGWFQDGAQRYYGDTYIKNKTLYVGVVTGYMTDEYLHYFAADGAYRGTRGVENGWYALGNEWLYFENGKLAHGYRVIGGVGYYFEGGYMLTNGIGWDDERYYYFGSNGAQVTTPGWHKTSEGWIYVRANGTLCNGIWKIGGTEYYFMGGLMVR